VKNKRRYFVIKNKLTSLFWQKYKKERKYNKLMKKGYKRCKEI
jgi:hypothetical protein